MAADAANHVEQVVEHVAAAGHAAPHAAAGGHGGIPELPNFITILSQRAHDHPLVGWLHRWENLVFSLIVALFLCALAWRHARKPALIPT